MTVTNNSEFVLKHGDTKQTFETGAQRDTADDKPRLDLLSPVFLARMGDLARTGAVHYGDRNWEKGMPLSRLLASAFRHLIATLDGQEDEDHAIQCAFNMMMYVHTLHKIRTGSLPIELDDVCREQNLGKKNMEPPLTRGKKQPTIVAYDPRRGGPPVSAEGYKSGWCYKCRLYTDGHPKCQVCGERRP